MAILQITCSSGTSASLGQQRWNFCTRGCPTQEQSNDHPVNFKIRDVRKKAQSSPGCGQQHQQSERNLILAKYASSHPTNVFGVWFIYPISNRTANGTMHEITGNTNATLVTNKCRPISTRRETLFGLRRPLEWLFWTRCIEEHYGQYNNSSYEEKFCATWNPSRLCQRQWTTVR